MEETLRALKKIDMAKDDDIKKVNTFKEELSNLQKMSITVEKDIAG